MSKAVPIPANTRPGKRLPPRVRFCPSAKETFAPQLRNQFGCNRHALLNHRPDGFMCQLVAPMLKIENNRDNEHRQGASC